MVQRVNGKVDYQRSPQRKHTTDTPFDVSSLTALPKVGIIYNYANASDALAMSAEYSIKKPR